MKKIKLLKTLLIPTIGISAIGTIAAVSTSCSSSVVPVTGVSLDKESLVLGKGDSDTLTATIHPENATDKSVTWSSSDHNVVSVDINGNVTAINEGQATITVTTNDGGFTDICQVTVSQKIQVIGVLLNKSSLELNVDNVETLTATVFPKDATDKSVTWSSSDSSVATVDNNGKVTAVSEGSAKITVKTNDGGYEDYCDVIVTEINFIKITANADSNLELINTGENNPNLQYSTDCVNWTTYSGRINITQGHNIYLKGDNANGWSEGSVKYSFFKITGNVSLSGNVMSLLDNGTGTTLSIPNNYCFFRLFYSSTGITYVNRSFLSANTLALRCYSLMFEDCTSLKTAPGLPATTLADHCYDHMFSGCTSLKTAPELPATTLADHCYDHMFSGCTSLTTAPGLPATTLASNCYECMFWRCTSLATAPDLPATKLANQCYYNMFFNCDSLTTAPNLPAIQLTDYCYSYMFEACTLLTTVPDLPATKLATSCYIYMFSGCTSLTTAPNLPATTLADHCYEYMFHNCTKLASVRISYNGTVSEASSGGSFTNWVTGVAQTGTFYYKGSDTLENFGFPSGWTINPN